MPRRLASDTSSKRPTLPPPDFGFIRSTALPAVRRCALFGGDAGGVVAAGRTDPRIAPRAAAAKTSQETTKMTSSSRAPRAIIATAAPTRAPIVTAAAMERVAPRRVSIIQPAAAATATAASTISSVTQFLTRSIANAATTAATASSATQAARRPTLPSRAFTTRRSPLQCGCASHKGGEVTSEDRRSTRRASVDRSLVLRLPPAVAGADVDRERRVERVRVAHLRAHELLHRRDLRVRRLDEQLVVNLKDETGAA